MSIGERLEPRFGRLGSEYPKIAFDKALLPSDPTLEWVTPGHPLFEVGPRGCPDRVADHLRRGAIFFDLQRKEPARLDAFAASIKDGRGNCLHRRLVRRRDRLRGAMSVRQPTIFLDGWSPPRRDSAVPDDVGTPRPPGVERVPAGAGACSRSWPRSPASASSRSRRSAGTSRSRSDADRPPEPPTRRLPEPPDRGADVPGLDGLISQAEGHLDRLNERLEGRLRELEMERHCTIADITHLGRAWVLPHPERATPALAPMVRDEEIERIAVEFATRHEEARGWQVESVETENRGFDLISRRPHPEDPKTSVEVRFIEVKGRAGVGEIALTANEYKTAGRLKDDYWLYAVFNCGGTPELHVIQDPATLGWVPVVQVEHYQIDPGKIFAAGASGGNPEKGPGSSWSLRARSTQKPKRLDFDDRE